MRSQKVLAKRFEFYFADLDNSILVERAENGNVIIRAVRDNVSEERKAFFIRLLAAEGFIPDMYQWFQGAVGPASGIHWMVDYSWLKIPPEVKRRARNFMAWLIISITVLWLVIMAAVILPRLEVRFKNAAKNSAPPPATAILARSQSA